MLFGTNVSWFLVKYSQHYEKQGFCGVDCCQKQLEVLHKQFTGVENLTGNGLGSRPPEKVRAVTNVNYKQ